MKLKYKLLVAFLIIVLLPAVLLALLTFGASITGAGQGSISFFAEEFGNSKESQRALLDVVISIILVLVFTAIILVIWIYQSVISKVNKLIFAANNIKEGDFSFSIAAEGGDELSELINTFEDMKERLKQDSEEKLMVEKEQRELISNIAHDLKTPLTAIRGYAEGLLDGVADTEEKKEQYIRTISKKAEDLNILLNELTTYSNITTSRIPYNFEHLKVRDYFLDLCEEISMDIERNGGTLNFKMDLITDPEMIVDPEQLRRVIENVVGNSIKYKSDVPLVLEVRVRELEGYIQVEFEDNGKGIKNEDLPYIFDRTYRADASRKSGVGGSGLGLAISKKIVEDHGGRIWASSRLAEGTCIYLILQQYTLSEVEEKNEQNSDNRRRRSNSRS